MGGGRIRERNSGCSREARESNTWTLHLPGSMQARKPNSVRTERLIEENTDAGRQSIKPTILRTGQIR